MDKRILLVDGRVCSTVSYAEDSHVDLIKLHENVKPDIAIMMDTSLYVDVDPPYDRFYYSISRHYVLFTKTFQNDFRSRIQAIQEVCVRALLKIMSEVYGCDDGDKVHVTIVSNSPELSYLMQELDGLDASICVYTNNGDIRRMATHLRASCCTIAMLPRMPKRKKISEPQQEAANTGE